MKTSATSNAKKAIKARAAAKAKKALDLLVKVPVGALAEVVVRPACPSCRSTSLSSTNEIIPKLIRCNQCGYTP
jgi:hypothetical protein